MGVFTQLGPISEVGDLQRYFNRPAPASFKCRVDSYTAAFWSLGAGTQRREFICILAGGAVAALLTNRLLGAEKFYRIGYLAAGFRQLPSVDAFVKELQERGYSEGRNLEIEWREAKGRSI